MSSTSIAKASRVDRALERLETAVEKLDVASMQVTGSIKDADTAALRDENAKLKSLNLDAAEKLSQTIERLEATLNSEGNS